ncbi:MAG: DUF4236 domain-containing protein [Chloroflexota bacterium]
MPLRFWRRVKVAPGVTINLGKRGASVSLGPRGSKTTLGRSGVRQTVGLPGTGLFATQQLRRGQRGDRPPATGEPTNQPPATDVSADEGDLADERAGVSLAGAGAPPVPWRATLLIVAGLTVVVAVNAPSDAVPFAVVATPIALVLAWALRRHPGGVAVLLVAIVVGALAVVPELVAGLLSLGVGGRRR